MNYKRNPYLILVDESHFNKADLKKRELIHKNNRCEIHTLKSPLEWKKLEDLFTEQSLDTMVIIYADHETSQLVEQKAVSVGFSSRRITIEAGPSQIYRIFCSQCQDINKNRTFDQFTCQKCGQHLEPTDHYSEFHRAFLGFPIL